jgi:hypothetical protein
VKTGDLVCVKGIPNIPMSVRWARNGVAGIPTSVTCTWFKADGSVAEFEFKYEQLAILKAF